MVKVNGKKVHQIANIKPESFQNVMVYAADPWYPPVNGKIKNLIVTEKRS